MANWGLELIAGIALVVACLLLLLVIRICVARKNRGRDDDQQRRHRQSPNPPYLRHDQGNSSSGANGRARNQSWNSIKIAGFNWKDYPALMSEALENGWAAFALSQVDHGMDHRPHHRKQGFHAETRWEVGPGTELMQILRSNPGIPIAEISSTGSAQFFKSALPLPGPFLGIYSYPQESYFEITVLGAKDHDLDKNARQNSGNSTAEIEQIVAIGLVRGSSFGDRGSIGYYSNGQILLNGALYTDERFKRKPWIPARGDTTVGCGFNPAARIVFFTLNGEMTCQADCSRAEEFGSPLHAAFLCNFDATAIVNLGQSAFEFLPENARRTADPGNHRPYPDRGANRMAIQYDSGELFSQRLEGSPALSQDLRRPTPSEAESELFEIVIDAEGNERFVHR
ncbi:hypothetical protein SELMODRAFT_412047 [Selaginella moellendorffii]|uniref:B30.2/SPRY domain-containing protein n=1 Tax=Selaginella moellendorffii TaxID=88036 RepID=D8RJV8_SELML|nr:uncharacterized protein LOC9642290 [Selaginella moellendorffii]EFJ27784.1 hypothetical protein SELMODRAFT_412047 [Selaginella moellendorffii]|eukprot:XP_002971186.1 uncharacterized protein LOC9642290 [Selaginella moellendorffii]